ncbi:HAD family hydrolase [Ktedonosporobacter rubrisoli]|uniref:HAD family hydrolase n=1 Tax=Ktedonosporobacter rubrisoli TaxID=2509675 RepID=A0A4P6JWK4_KTERU|nr:HAD family hydrolase [Ktedonosporobacter rubrisoli]QBD79954.1 HAD family hydrolase [Ktedonosporobacter rubrisoli]
MNNSAYWKRQGLQFPSPFDTVFFDVDGVLIRTIDSFHATDIAVAEYIAGTICGLDWGQSEGKALVTLKDVDAFKRAGGYNNDWDMCYLLSALFTAKLREWRGSSLAERSIQEWAEISRSANLEGHGGREWVDTVVPASARQDYQFVGELYHECYWGAAELEKRFGHKPRYLPDAPGFVHTESMLYAPDFPARLRQAGIQHLGIITGRVGPEVDSALEHMEAYSGQAWWDVVVSADLYAKPDPRALRVAIAEVKATGGLFIGDTADDHDLVHNYRATQSAAEPGILAVVLINEEKDAAIYQQRGADFIVQEVEDVLWCLPEADRHQASLSET